MSAETCSLRAGWAALPHHQEVSLGQVSSRLSVLPNAQGLDPLGLRGTLGHPSLPPPLSPAETLTWLLLGSLLDLDAFQLHQARGLCRERSSLWWGPSVGLVGFTPSPFPGLETQAGGSARCK